MTDAVQYCRFDTAGVSARDRFDFWRSWYSEAVDVPMRLDPVAAVPADFRASAESLRVDGLEVVELHCGPARGHWRRADTEESDLLRLVALAPSPGATGRWHGHTVSLARGHTVLLGRTGGSWEAPAGLHGIQINVGRDALPVPDAQVDRVTDSLQFALHSPALSLLRPALLGMSGRLADLATVTGAEFTTAWQSMLTLLLRTLVDADAGMDGIDVAAARLAQAHRYIEAHLADPRLCPETVAAALHMSRRSLYTVFATDGHGVATEIRRRRLHRAHALLAGPTRPARVASVAALVGIGDAAQFSRLFHAEFGYPPREAREHPVAPPAAALSTGSLSSTGTCSRRP